MPAARYWRVVGLSAVGGSDLELSELQLYGASGRADAAATLTCSHTPAAGALTDLKDASTGSVCLFAGADVRSGGFWLGWDFGSAADISGVRPGSGSAQGTWLVGLTLQYFEAGGWVTAFNVAGFSWPGPSSMDAAPVAGDAEFSKVVLLLHGDDAPGATSITDSSAGVRTVTASGGAATAAFAPAFGGSAIRFPGAGVVLVPHEAAFDFSGAWCVEMDFWPTSTASAQMLFNKADGTGAGYPVQFFMAVGGTVTARSYDAGGNFLWSITSTAALSANARNTIAVSHSGSTYRLLIGGAPNGTATYSGPVPSNTAPISIGAYSNGVSPASGHIEEVRLTIGAERRTGSYTPSSGPFPGGAGSGGQVFGAIPVRGVESAALVAAATPVSAHSAGAPSLAVTARDVEVGGPGTIYGTTKTKGSPNAPTKARVVLAHQRSKLPVRETWSDPTTGYFEFRGVDVNQQFLTLAEDADGTFRPVAANRLTPEVLT